MHVLKSKKHKFWTLKQKLKITKEKIPKQNNVTKTKYKTNIFFLFSFVTKFN